MRITDKFRVIKVTSIIFLIKFPISHGASLPGTIGRGRRAAWMMEISLIQHSHKKARTLGRFPEMTFTYEIQLKAKVVV